MKRLDPIDELCVYISKTKKRESSKVYNLENQRAKLQNNTTI